jgi:hypothetical protein
MVARSDLKKALSCQCTVKLAQTAQRVVEASRQAAAPLPYSAQGEHRFDLLANNDAARVTYLNLEGEPQWSFVRRAGTRASSFWDHEKRFALHFTEEEVSHTRVAAASAIRTKVRTRGSISVAELTITDANVGTLRHVLKFDRRPALSSFGRALFRILYGGPSCHQVSKFPVEQLEELGVLAEASVYIGDEPLPISQLTVREAKPVGVRRHDFEPPRDFPDYSNKTPSRAPTPTPSVSKVEPAPIPIRPRAGEGLRTEADRKVLADFESTLPDCLGSTRFGSMAALVHQDLLNHATVIVNTIAPLLGTATLNNGTLTVPWLAALQAIPIGSPTAAGSGISCLLRSIRIPSTPTAAASGGGGLLDRLAHRNLTEPDASGQSRLQREVASGAISNTMHSWGVTATSFISDLIAANGDLSLLPLNEQIAILEGYELSELGTLKIDGFPKDQGDFDPLKGMSGAEGLITGHLWSMTGSMNFSSLAGGPLIPTAAIGSSGDIDVTLVLPTTTLTATSTWQLTTKGAAILYGGTIATCVVVPVACPAALLLASVLGWFVNKQLSVISAATSGVTLSLNISYRWDAPNSLVNPFVTVTGTTGSIVVSPAFFPSSLFGFSYFQAIIAAVGDIYNLWLPLAALATAQALQFTLRSQGLSFPLGAEQLGIEAIQGSAHSAAGKSLTLLAEVAPRRMSSSQPYVTQVPTAELVSDQLEIVHTLMRAALNPQPMMPPPGPGPVISVANYAALAVSQNALNYYIFSRWLARDYEIVITDPSAIATILALAPANVFPGTVTRIHAWPAVSPRVEVAEESLARGGRPVMAFLDDVRVCFESATISGEFPPIQIANAELSFNCKTTATVSLTWPMVVNVLMDDKSSTDSEMHVWEFADLNNLNIAATVPSHAWAPLASSVAAMILASESAAGVLPFAHPPAWPRPIPGGPAEEFAPDHAGLRPLPEVFYMEVLGRRRALYMPTGLSSSLLELVDGSGAPTLNAILGTTGVTMSTMTCIQGRKLRLLLPILDLGPQHAVPGP